MRRRDIIPFPPPFRPSGYFPAVETVIIMAPNKALTLNSFFFVLRYSAPKNALMTLPYPWCVPVTSCNVSMPLKIRLVAHSSFIPSHRSISPSTHPPLQLGNFPELKKNPPEDVFVGPGDDDNMFVSHQYISPSTRPPLSAWKRLQN